MTDAALSPARIVLATPPRGDLAPVAQALPAALETGLVATVRLDLPGGSEDELKRACDLLRPICHAADVALVIRDHHRLVTPMGLDGAQVEMKGAPLKKVRAEMPKDAILGVACGASRHDGMTAGEAGADYVLFAPFTPDPLVGDPAPLDLFQWWAEIIETPVVAEGGIGEEEARTLSPFADYVVPALTIWNGDLAANLRRLHAALA